MDESLIRLNRIHYPVTALGAGRRIGVWVQGCGIGCRGCVSKDTWDPGAAPLLSVADIGDEIGRLVGDDQPDGLTISGGEPFEQAAAVASLVDIVRDRYDHGSFDVLVFSGLSWHRVASHPALVAKLDTVVAGPYVETLAIDNPLRSSSNQTIEALTPRGEDLYVDRLDEVAPRRRAQVVVDGGQLLMIGLPRPHEMARLADALAAQGVTIGKQSWVS